MSGSTCHSRGAADDEMDEARDEAEAAVAWQSVGLQEEDPMWSAGGLDL